MRSTSSIQILSLFFMVMVLFSIIAWGQEPYWLKEVNQIVPLTSSQSDVETILDVKGTRYPHQPDWYYYLVEYNTKRGRWYLQYSTGKCSEEKKEGFDVEEGVVINVYLRIDRKIRLKKSDIDLSEFERYVPPDLSLTFFTDYQRGIKLTVGSNMLLGSISRFPSRKFHHLRCGH